ncbi:hypothetical protein OCH239_01250 [Roseivivax halodurans JCM 10272]|uniref:non-specific protein-tyrosine kinase n=1 Tax=Roseivivax halodurans JCM 10272 TaxID=1449350 RepID=X7ELA5_9RHOB|nr:hypothetical protein OCH239_01250 [Roseivivax halodurans JCM 10272]
MDIGALALMVWRNIGTLAAAVAVAVLLGAVYAFLIATPLYRTSASMVLDAGSSDVVSQSGVPAEARASEAILATKAALIRSRPVLGQVVDQLNLMDDPEFNENAAIHTEASDPEERANIAARDRPATVQALEEAVNLRNVPGTLIVDVAVTTRDPAKSQDIVNTLVDTYLEEQVAVRRADAQDVIERLSDRLSDLQAQLGETETRIEAFQFSGDPETRSAETVELERLAGEAEATREMSQFMLTRLKETAARQSLLRPDARVVSYATMPQNAVAPRKKLIVFFAALFGGMAGLAAVYLRDSLRGGLHSPRELEHAARTALFGVTPKVASSRLGPVRAALKGLQDPVYATAIEDIRTTLASRPGASGTQIIAVTSARAGEGKTVLASSLAASFGSGGRQVLLIDADMRSRGASVDLAPEAERGLVALCHGTERLAHAILHDAAYGFDFLPCEDAPSNAVDLLSSPELAEILAEARSRYDLVIVDMPSVLPAPDVRVMGHLVDVLVFLARHDKTPARAIDDALVVLERAGLAPSGTVMSQMPRRRLARRNPRVAGRALRRSSGPTRMPDKELHPRPAE